MKKIKKKINTIIIFCIIMTVIITGLFYIIYVGMFNEKPSFSMAIISDPHLMAAEQIGQDSEDFYIYEAKGQKMLAISEAIFNTAVDEMIKSDASIILLPGDLTDDGGRVSHLVVAKGLKRIEDSGKKVFVMPGNHDINNHSYTFVSGEAETTQNIDADDFEQIYADFGYKEALVRDENTLSYVADLDKSHRLIAIDCSYYDVNTETGYVDGRNEPYMTNELLSWSESQIVNCVKAGKTPIAMMHFPLTNHFGNIVGSFANNSKVNRSGEVGKAFVNAGLKYIFTGHLHTQDISKFSGEKGDIYDVETASLSNYPMPIRFYRDYSRGIKLTTENLLYVNEKYIPHYISNEDKINIKSNFTEYARNYVDKGMKAKIFNKITIENISKILKYFGIESSTEEAQNLAEDIQNNLVRKLFDMPLYEKDKISNEKTVESICKRYDIILPNSEYKTVWNLFMAFLKANYHGDECYKFYSTEGVLFKYCFYTIIYAVADYDLFGKMNALNTNIENVDLMSFMEDLYKNGVINVVDSNFLLSFVNSFTPLKNSSYSSLIGTDASEILKLAKVILKYIEFYGINFSEYIDGEKGYLLIGNIIHDIVFGDTLADLITDSYPKDNDIMIVRKTNCWEEI